MESTFFAELPKELLQEIFLYLNRRDLRTIEEIFNEVLNDNFWIAYFKWDPQDYHRYIKISKVDTYFQRNVMYLNTKDDIDHKKKKFLAYGNTLGFTISNNKY